MLRRPPRRSRLLLLAALLGALALASAAGALSTLPADRALGPERTLTDLPAMELASDGRFLLFLKGRGDDARCATPRVEGADPLPEICTRDWARFVSVDLVTGRRLVLEEQTSRAPRAELLDEGRYLLHPRTLVDLATGGRTPLALRDGFQPALLAGDVLLGSVQGNTTSVHLATGETARHPLDAPAGAVSVLPTGLENGTLALQWVDRDAGYGARASLADLDTGELRDVPMGDAPLAEPARPDARSFVLSNGRLYALTMDDDGRMALRILDAATLDLLHEVALPERATLFEGLTVSGSLWVAAYQGPNGHAFAWGDLEGRAVHAPQDDVERANAVAAGSGIAYQRGGVGQGVTLAAPGAPPVTAMALAAVAVASLLIAILLVAVRRRLPRQQAAAPSLGAGRCRACDAPRDPTLSFCATCGAEGA